MSHFQLQIGSNATPIRNGAACAVALFTQRLCCSLCIPSEFSEFLLVMSNDIH